MIQSENIISKGLQFSTFYLGQVLFGIDMLNIQEINKQSEITRVPQAPEEIEGILNLRGKIVTIIDLGKKLGLAPVNKNKSNRNIIVDSEDEYIGLRVDAVGDVVTAAKEDIEPAPSNMGGAKGKWFQGVLQARDHLIGILDIDKVLNE